MARTALWTIERAPAAWPWVLTVALASPAFATSTFALAQEPAAEGEEEEEEEQPKLEVHGFLTQAYAQTDGAQILGITEDGTTDYRAAAVQMRYRFSEDSSFVAQLSHESLGESPLQGLRDEVELDWLFYEQRWEKSALRVGKVPIPFGIWNEVRDVGTVLPFYRPPRGFYGEGAFASETVDGVLVSHTRELGAGFGIDADLYFGDRQSFEVTDLGASEVEIDDSLGIQLWLETPLPDLRLGVGAQRFEVRNSLVGPPGGEDLWEQVIASLEGQAGWFVVRGEIQWADSETIEFRSYYLQLGAHLGSRFELNLQAEWSDLELLPPLPLADLRVEEDLAIGLVYRLRPYLVIKAEVHDNEGFLTDPISSIFGPRVETTYGILSLSTSF